MRILIFLFLITVAGASKAQDQFYNYNASNYLHNTVVNGQKVTFYVSLSDKKPDVQSALTYYWSDQNRVNATQGGFSGKLLTGKYTVYYQNKNLREQGTFKLGLKDGEWRTWREDGSLELVQHFRDGKLQGDYSKFNATGHPAETGTYKNGLLDGKQTTFSGDSTRVLIYRKGILQQDRQTPVKWVKQLFTAKEKQ